MNKEFWEEYNKKLFEDVECCKCGAHSGVYTRTDDNGFWYVCNDCDLPISCSYHPFDSSSYRRDENCDN